MLVVKKFGGSSVASRELIFNVAERCIEDYEKGHDVVVVLSAMGDSTDDLIAMAKGIDPKAPRREMDMLLSTGEQVSVALLAIALHSRGIPCISLNAFQVPMETTGSYSASKLKRIGTERIRTEIDNHNIVIVTGFQGVNSFGDVTTLGRGGSDTTAVGLAAALKADICEIYTDVDGVFTCDPRVVPGAKKLKEISYDEMLEFASLGANVLHNRSVELAKKFNVNLVVRSSLNRTEGTTIKEMTKDMEKMLVSGVAIDKDTARVSIIGVKHEPGMAFTIFNELAKKDINVDMILQSIGRYGTKDIVFTIKESELDTALGVLKVIERDLGANGINCDKNVAKVSIVGAGMTTHPGVAARMFEALAEAGINIHMISTSEIHVSVLIDEAEATKAARAIHETFNLAD